METRESKRRLWSGRGAGNAGVCSNPRPKRRDETMNLRASLRLDSRLSADGFSLIEMVIVLCLVSVVLAIATPAIVGWRNNMYYGQTTRNFTSVLRQARSLSMALNRQHYVVFKPNSSAGRGVNAYQVIRRSVDPTNTTFTNYSCVQRSGVNAVVSLQGTTASPTKNIGFTFNPNGTALLSYPGGIANDGNVGIYNGTTQKYLLTVSRTGKIISTHSN